MSTVDEDERHELYDWHLTFLLELGVSWDSAQQHADLIDPHEVARVIRKGCPPDLAVEIVR